MAVFDQLISEIRAGEITAQSGAKSLYNQLDKDERLWLLDGDVSVFQLVNDVRQKLLNQVPYRAGEIKRLAIPGIRFSDGPRGVTAGTGKSTAFPTSSTRACTFNPDLELQVVSILAWG